MPNPYLPHWEYIPDGEPRVFGNRVYVYGSHDKPDQEVFCDHKLKVWSADINDLNNWVCHGDAFRTKPDDDHGSDVDYTDCPLFAPDVVEKDGKYYLYAYICGAEGCVGVSERPEGPFKFLSKYNWSCVKDHYDKGTFIDPGVLVDDDGRVYVYCGFKGSYMCELDPNDMCTVIPGTYMENFLPKGGDNGFFEAASPRKVGDTYYMIYSPNVGSRLAYATAPGPRGPFTYRGYIVDNGVDYPGGNDHGSIMCIKGQWYIFYHRMTNGSIMSRRGCVEPITIKPDGTIETVEMTSLGFEKALNPYIVTRADTACVIRGSGLITEIDPFHLILTNIKKDTELGWKYYDFGEDYTCGSMRLFMDVIPRGCSGKIHVYADEVKDENEIGVVDFNRRDTFLSGRMKKLTGRHSVFFKIDDNYTSWAKDEFEGRLLFDLVSFVFVK